MTARHHLWWYRIKRLWRITQVRWFGYRGCDRCRKLVKPRFVKDVVLFEDEPPLFGHYECPGCGLATPIMPSGLTEDAVRKLGYGSFDDYARRNGLLKEEM